MTTRRKAPQLRFTPMAWAKLLYLRDLGRTEVGGFGVAAADDLLLVEDFRLVQQRTSSVSVSFDADAVADYFDDQVDLGLPPSRFARIWIHTHPGDSPHPSGQDEETFADVFGPCDWSVMFIIAQGGKTYARLQFGTGPGGSLEIPVRVAWHLPFPGSDHAAWGEEYVRCIVDDSLVAPFSYSVDSRGVVLGPEDFADDDRLEREFDRLDSRDLFGFGRVAGRRKSEKVEKTEKGGAT